MCLDPVWNKQKNDRDARTMTYDASINTHTHTESRERTHLAVDTRPVCIDRSSHHVVVQIFRSLTPWHVGCSVDVNSTDKSCRKGTKC